MTEADRNFPDDALAKRMYIGWRIEDGNHHIIFRYPADELERSGLKNYVADFFRGWGVTIDSVSTVDDWNEIDGDSPF